MAEYVTPEQYRLYTGMLRLGRTYGKGPRSTGVRGETVGVGATTFEALPAATGYFLPNNRVAERSSLPNLPIYTADWWWITGIDTDVEVYDIRTDGSTYAFVITGAPDTSQGFQAVPAAKTAIPDRIETPIRIIAGFQAGLRIGAR